MEDKQNAKREYRKSMEDKKRTYKKALFSMENGKLQPQAIELEEAVLGACLLESEALHMVSDIINPECFYKEQNGIIYGAIMDLYKKNHPVDILTVCQQLKQLEQLEFVGGSFYVSSLTDKIASSSNIEIHARIVVEQYLKRELIMVSVESIKDAYEEGNDVFDIYEREIQKLEGAVSGVMKYDVQSIGKIHQSNNVERVVILESGGSSGVPSGYRAIDKFTNGWQKTDLIIIAGRPAMGKSICALAFVLNPAIEQNIPTALFSLEMSSSQVVGRAESSLSGINSGRIIKHQLDIDEIRLLEQKCSQLNVAPFYIDDTPALSLMEFKGKARKLVRDKKVKLIAIDYLQLMTVDAGRGNREQEISMISRGLKAIAKELGVPIIALSQLSRAVETRGGEKTPQLSDLRESGAIEQDADLVIFCYRPEYYDMPTYEINKEVVDSDGLMVLIVAKNRSGKLGDLKLGVDLELTKLENYSEFIDKKIQQPENTYKPAYNPIIVTENAIGEPIASSISNNIDFLKQ